jgi:hypothetical protein
MCDRGGVYRDKGKGIRSTNTKKCNCPFKLQGRYMGDYGWKVIVKDHRHNHLTDDIYGHAYARRMSVQEEDWVGKSHSLNTVSREIFAGLRNEFPNNLSTLKDVYNLQDKIRNDEAQQVGNTPMQVMLSLLHILFV